MKENEGRGERRSIWEGTDDEALIAQRAKGRVFGIGVLLLLYTVFIALVIWFTDIVGSVGDSFSAVVAQVASMVGACVCGVLAVVFSHWPTTVWYRRLRVWSEMAVAVMVMLCVAVAVVAHGERYVGDYIGLFVAPVFCVLGILKEASLVGLRNVGRPRNKRVKGGKRGR
ncbi:hypothetical protein OZX67_07170 [Bifidobacterium sp. ESL0728]|uniref:hypothetical protein n=1 Tax=Bifidobacterium sp. ESL0728 TaxID=2983220 RepID=UPI0023F86A36|nr:hypothetical protein [Bifidobacterium sp. ESL0728]WEV58578.1 hypothetical protein OZX67_07170 [Bifidobacterium sp. ESL0728]